VGFLFAQAFHPAMRHVGPVRGELGVRTIFNLLGPLTNPAGTKRLVVGVFHRRWCRPLAEALSLLGTERTWVVHGSDGLDEITTTGPTHVASWDGTSVTEFDISPADASLPTARASDLKGGEAPENAKILRDILSGEKGPKRDIVVFNAAAALVVGGVAADLDSGARLAERAIDSGKALLALETLVETSRALRS
jgi:anthranilate phosphoribosyltransferase